MNRHTASRVKALTERRLSGEELREWLDPPIGEDERAEVRALIHWFRRRYPTPADRLAYVRRAYARWTASTLR